MMVGTIPTAEERQRWRKVIDETRRYYNAPQVASENVLRLLDALDEVERELDKARAELAAAVALNCTRREQWAKGVADARRAQREMDADIVAGLIELAQGMARGSNSYRSWESTVGMAFVICWLERARAAIQQASR